MAKAGVRLAIALLGSVTVFAVAYLILGREELLNNSDRFLIWKFMMARWASPANLPFGTGLGTYHVFSINLQHYGSVAPGFFWSRLHNEWLQMVFEGGFLGAALMVGTYFIALYRVMQEKRREVAAAILLFGIYMGANSALHHAPPAIFGAWIFVYALRKRTFTYEARKTILL